MEGAVCIALCGRRLGLGFGLLRTLSVSHQCKSTSDDPDLVEISEYIANGQFTERMSTTSDTGHISLVPVASGHWFSW